ncbi:hypothetical protein CP977_00815 [Streptomyces cinereoruber]|uniref:Secreted protein n=1 Tax=Streptomyces cinereoruber TaxID=67260 RepID=A0ABX6B6I6_9ACTN|nr:hypothetical protein CP977_00815 [Streptomyces cinereoruber]
MLRGPAEPLPHSARTLAALTANPRCDRRTLLDAAGIDKPALATHLGLPQPMKKSRLALDHGLAFERQVTDPEQGVLLSLLRKALQLPLPRAYYKDINNLRHGNGTAPLGLRRTHTSQLILGTAEGKSTPHTLLDHPVLTLNVAGRQTYLEPDAIALRHDDVFHIVEIRSFPVIHGRADPLKAAVALTQAAAYILALRELLTRTHRPATQVSDTVVLINPRNFTFQPTATTYNAAPQIKSLSRHLTRLDRLPDLLETLPPDTTCDLATSPDGTPTRPRDNLIAALATMKPHYTPGCRHHCDLATHCRTEARNRGSIGALGTTVRDDLAGIDTLHTALDLADNHVRAISDHEDTTHALRHAQRIHDELTRDST